MRTCIFAERGCRAEPGTAEWLCFVAGPCIRDVQSRIDTLVGAAEDVGLRCLVAERQQQFSRDIFCEKICRPIIESRFCLVLLDDVPSAGGAMPGPNPNVYFEYGLMCALRKVVLAFQPKDQRPPFNIAHLDLIEYDVGGLGSTARTVLEAALAKTAAQYRSRAARRGFVIPRAISPTLRAVRRVLELRGYEPALPGVLGGNIVASTVFEPWRKSDSLWFVALIEEDGARAREVGKDAVVLARRLSRLWGRARAIAFAAKSKQWRAEEAEYDMALLQRSSLLVVCALASEEAGAVRRELPAHVDADFGQINVIFWEEADLKRAESELGLGSGRVP